MKGWSHYNPTIDSSWWLCCWGSHFWVVVLGRCWVSVRLGLRLGLGLDLCFVLQWLMINPRVLEMLDKYSTTELRALGLPSCLNPTGSIMQLGRLTDSHLITSTQLFSVPLQSMDWPLYSITNSTFAQEISTKWHNTRANWQVVWEGDCLLTS